MSVLSTAWPCSLPSRSQYFALFWHITTYLYNYARALPLALIYPLLSICLRPSWEILIFCQLHGNESTVTHRLPASGVFSFDIFLLRPKRFLFADSIFVGRRGPCFIHVISFHYISFWGSTSFDGCASSCWIPGMFFLGRIRRKGGGGTKSSLNSLVKTFISSIRCFCWSVSSELLLLSFRLTFSLFSF